MINAMFGALIGFCCAGMMVAASRGDRYMVTIPCQVGDRVYELTEDNKIKTFIVQDIAVKEIKYADDWYTWNQIKHNTFFDLEEAESEARRRETSKR